MKTIGLIGGMSWESTVTYYQKINQIVQEKLGGLHSAEILLFSIDFAELAEYQENDEWDKAAQMMKEAAKRLEKGGADLLLICANTMHKALPYMTDVKIPVLHIATATAAKLTEDGVVRVGLLGTKYTLLQDFYKAKIAEAGIEVLIPESEAVEEVNRIIYDELCRGILRDSSRDTLLKEIANFKERGAQGVILGCTELDLLVNEKDSCLPVYDTTMIHAEAAALEALKED
ncbi:MAG: aspartate/glutamate racemase family protein [Erysipelotrichaceae bacterium]|nr:aspartate/glutamate racemase family protein [Erysipelotrichaceae bacterium]MBR4122646.1 aspartate/glutamate racemase family protein [Erysipelotrichaceae bacterium]